MNSNDKYDVAAYVWPSYTGDEPRTRMFWPEGNGEWETVRKAGKKYPGHEWPRKPLWGYVNEADPYVMEMQINAAADHHVNVFIYDWYWYDNRPFLEQCLNNGYLKARNNDRMKFYLMWANHDVNNLWDLRISNDLDANIIWKAALSRSGFEHIAENLIEKYFKHPGYYCIDDKPVFMIYDLQNLMDGLGGADATAQAMNWFRDKAIEAGLPGLHLQATLRSSGENFSGVDSGVPIAQKKIIFKLGFDSISHYQYAHFTDIDRDYADIMKEVESEWLSLSEDYSIPYFPHVSIGWDNNPRFTEFRPGIVTNNTPAAIEKALKSAKNYVDTHPEQAPLITINSWNEWTETSYLQPDDLYGYGYLEAVCRVFK